MNNNLKLSIVLLPPYSQTDLADIRRSLIINNSSGITLEFIEKLEDSTGELVAFLSPLDIITDNWLDSMIEIFKNENLGTAGSKIIDVNNKILHAGIVFDKDFKPYFIYKGLDEKFYGANKYRFFNCIYCEGLVIRKNLLLDCGGFDLRKNPFDESLRLSYELSQRRKIKTLYNPKAVLKRKLSDIEITYSSEFHFPQDDILFYQEDTIQVDRSLIIRDYSINEPPNSCILCGSSEVYFIESIGEYDIYKCPNCKLEFSNPMKSPDYGLVWELAEDYRHRLENWWNLLKIHRDPEYIEGYYLLPLKVIKAISEVIPSPSLLEIGFGEGLFLYDAYELGFNIYGIEASPTAVNIVRNYIPKANLFCSEEFTIPSDWPKEFDVIASFEVIEHLEDPKELIEFSYNHLKPGGILMLGLPNRKRLGADYGNIGIMDNPPHHLTRWEKETLVYLLNKFPWKFYYVTGTKPHFNVIFSQEGLRLPPNIVLSIMGEKIEVKSIDIIKLWKDFIDKLIYYIPRDYGRILQAFAQKDGGILPSLEEVMKLEEDD